MRQYDVSGMSCAACSLRVERAVGAVDGVEKCTVNLLTNSMIVEGSATDEKIIKAVAAAGYGASPKGEKMPENDNQTFQNGEKNRILARLVASVILLLPLMYLSMGYVMWGFPLPAFLSHNPLGVAILELLISGIILVINQKFFISGARALVGLSPNMDTLVAIGSAASYLYSVSVVLVMSGDVSGAHSYLHGLYFESAAMILTLITVGKMLEARAKGRTTDAIKELMQLSPRTATVIRDGVEMRVSAEEVRVGDIFLVRPGESIAVDGVVVEGAGSVMESALTGESVPRDKEVGDTVLAATINQSGGLVCRATRVGGDTTIASVIKMVEDATATKAPIAKVADKVSGVFVPVVMAIALLTFSLWWAISGDFPTALARGISVLVISCPCALGLATPVAIMVGSGVGARLGILYKSAEALELTGRARTVALDKTGTITSGEMRVAEVIPMSVDESELVSLAAALEQNSEHPLARAVVSYADGRIWRGDIKNFKALAGSGVYAEIGGEAVYGGSYAFISTIADISGCADDYARLCDEGKTPIFFTRSSIPLGVIALSDTVREDSADAIRELKGMGMRVVMLTGDNERTAAAIGRAVGVDEVVSGVLPDGKEQEVRRLSAGGRVIMVGDGINDAPALTRADVGIAVGGGTDIAIDSADVVLMRNSLTDVTRAIRLGRAVLMNIYENLFWAFIYNLIGIPLAAGLFGWQIDPMFGAAAMSISSFSVVMNALRLNFFTKKYKKEKTATELSGKEENNMNITMKIEGMMCPHCEARVRDAITALDCVISCEVSHKDGTARVSAKDGAAEHLRAAVEGAGYKVLEIK